MHVYEVVLDERKWKGFCRILEGLKECCSAAVIKGGVIRQMSNCGLALFEVDMTSLLGDSNFVLPLEEENLRMLRLFTGQVKITVHSNSFLFSDEKNTLTFINYPGLGVNEFINEAKFRSLLNDVFKGTTLLLKHTIDQRIRQIFKDVSSLYGRIFFNVIFQGHCAYIGEEKIYIHKLCSLKINQTIPLAKPILGKAKVLLFGLRSFNYDGDIGWELYGKGGINGLDITSKYYGFIEDIKLITYTRGLWENDLD